MTPFRRGLILVAVVTVAALLAFPLREIIYETIVIPVAYIVWNLGLLYRSFSQGVWWWLIVGLVLFMLAWSLLPERRSPHRQEPKPKAPQGPVESFAIWLLRAEKGVYFKWMVANRLGRLAYQLLLQRENGRPRSVFAPLLGPDWEPRTELQQYLETGLHGSFADFPQTKNRFSAPKHTPLDLDVAEAVDFLESQMESRSAG
jgi:hypothetical protein